MADKDYEISDDFKLKESFWEHRSSSGDIEYTLIEYVGLQKEIVIPEYVEDFEKSAFDGKEIQSLTLPSTIPFYRLWSLERIESLRRLVSTSHGWDNIDFLKLFEMFPALETIEIQNASRLEISNTIALSEAGRQIEIRVTSNEIDRIIRRSYVYCPNLVLFAPALTPGPIWAPLRLNAIDTFLSHPDWYSEKSVKMYKGWLSRNLDTLMSTCADYNAETLWLKCLAAEGMRFPSKSYDRLMLAAEEAGNHEIVAAALRQKKEYYDLEKLAQREETLALNDMMNPLRSHAMKQIWSWGKEGKDGLVIRKYKGGPEDGILVENVDIDVPAEIAGKPVTALSGYVFKETNVRRIVIPESVNELYGGVFANSPVEEIVFEGTIRGFPDYCFDYCKNLSSVQCFGNALRLSSSEFEVPDSRPNTQPFVIGMKAFSYADIRYAWIQNALLFNEAFYWSQLRSVTLRDVLSVPVECFNHCKELTSADLQGCLEISYRAFYECSSLTDVHVSDSLFSVTGYAFEGCTSLKRIHLHRVKSPKRIKNLFSPTIQKSVEFVLEE